MKLKFVESHNTGTNDNTKNILHVGIGDLIAEASTINKHRRGNI